MSLIIAGIINTQTGEISDTVTRSDNRSADARAKTYLRLKVRDELNTEFGKNAFMSFELDSALTNISYIKGFMPKNKDVTRELDLLNAKYQLTRAQNAVDMRNKEITLAETAQETALSAFVGNDDETNLQREFITEHIDVGLHELYERRDESQSSVNRWESKIKTFEQSK